MRSRRAAHRKDRLSWRALLVQARNYNDLHDYAKALEVSNEALALRPLYHDAWLVNSAALYHQKRLNEALAASERFVELKPSASMGWTNLCTILIELERYEDALKAFDRAVEIAPDDRSLTARCSPGPTDSARGDS